MSGYNHLMMDTVFGEKFRSVIKDNGNVRVKGVSRELSPLYVSYIKKYLGQSILWLVGENENIQKLKGDLQLWHRFFELDEPVIHVHKLPWEDPYINNSIAADMSGEKSRFLADIDAGKNMIVITTVAALSIKLEKIVETGRFFKRYNCGEELSRIEFRKMLTEMGYAVKDRVEKEGDFAWRGSIVDLYPAGFDLPFRMEFEGRRVVSIREFEPESQKSVRICDHVDITRSTYFTGAAEEEVQKKVWLTELLNDNRIVANGLDYLLGENERLMESFSAMRNSLDTTEEPEVAEIFSFPVDSIKAVSLEEIFDDIDVESIGPSLLRTTFMGMNRSDADKIKKFQKSGADLMFCTANPGGEARVASAFDTFRFINRDIPYSFKDSSEGKVFISYWGEARQEGTGKENKSRNSILEDIVPGDFVVHKQHGIGKFTGFKYLDLNGEKAEFLTVEYQDKSNLYVPVHELDILSKYAGYEGHEPKIDKIGGTTWEAKKARARKNIVTFAKDLLDLYAKRKAIKGESFHKDVDIEDHFNQSFQFVETKGQKEAIRDVLRDLEEPYPMDRLVCGDVSFGKTEVALRAAIRVVTNGRQVAVLCPTTVLAYQHFSNFKKRFEGMPFRVELLSRMVTADQKKKVLAGLGTGEIDIVVGTHAILGKSVEFKDPGLFIIDEEQRFGVFQKEKLKKGREQVDVLSLSATPIPRTMSFAMAGLQDVSIINTPPIGRKAVKNYVGFESKQLIAEAVRREAKREGLTFIVYNNVEEIYDFRDRMASLIPEASFGVVHAQMPPDQVEEVLFRFMRKEYNVLVATTIIENGIDIPAVNTLIVMNAHRFGLTQLYQLRGRIGRSSKQAYGYFLIGKKGLSEKARSRLEAIREFADLGAGFKVAEFDLKLRGAGSLLGNKQHGHIEALGFDYFLGLLNKTIKEMKGEEEDKKETKFTIRFTYSISPEYIEGTGERIAVYKRILNTRTVYELAELKEEIEDRYGKLDEGLNKGFFVQSIRIISEFFEFEVVEITLSSIVIKLRPVYEGKQEQLREFFETFEARIMNPVEAIIEFKDYNEIIDTLQIFAMELE